MADTIRHLTIRYVKIKIEKLGLDLFERSDCKGGQAKIKAGGGWEIEDDNFLVSVFHPQCSAQ